MKKTIMDTAIMAGALGIVYIFVFEYDFGSPTLVDPVILSLHCAVLVDTKEIW